MAPKTSNTNQDRVLGQPSLSKTNLNFLELVLKVLFPVLWSTLAQKQYCLLRKPQVSLELLRAVLLLFLLAVQFLEHHVLDQPSLVQVHHV